jgi:catechol 2,3-dioxygenase-like lactoylglutathione lyase family enzyme
MNRSRAFALLLLALQIFIGATRAAEPTGFALSPGKLRYVTLVVKSHDEALRWYTEKLGFVKVSDQTPPSGVRWLVVAPPGQNDFGINLYDNPINRLDPATFNRRIGGETLWVFETADAKPVCAALKDRGVKFVEDLKYEPWGAQAIFRDLYGNEFVMVQPKSM